MITFIAREKLAAGIAFASALALAAPVLHAQSDDEAYGEETDMAGAEQQEHSALEEAVLEELQSIGIASLTIDKLSSGQLAGILLTLTATDRQDMEEAVTTIAANSDYEPGGIDAETVAGNERLRETVEAALVRAGWSSDVSQLSDEQVAALYVQLSNVGSLDEERIRDVMGDEAMDG